MDKKLAIIFVLALAGAGAWFFINNRSTDDSDGAEAPPASAPAILEEPVVKKLNPNERKAQPLLPDAMKTTGDGGAKPAADLGPEAKVVGTVFNPAGQPVAGAEITLFQYRPKTMANEGKQKVGFDEDVRTKTTTGEDGKYVFEGLSDVAGTPLTMRITKAGFVAALKDGIGPGMSVDFWLQAGAKIRGKITDLDTHQGVPDVTIELNQKKKAESLNQYMRWRVVVKTDAKGEYAVEGAPEGDITVLLEHEDYEQTFFMNPNDSRLKLSSLHENVLDFDIRRGLVLDGLVVDAITRKPIKGATVMLRGTIIPSDKQVTGAVGKFKMTGVKRGPQRVEIKADGYSRFGESVDFGDENMKKPMEFALKPCGTASGVVVDSTGNPVSGAEIFVAEKMALFMKVRDFSETKTDATGRFAVTNLNDGEAYKVAASANGYSIGASTNLDAVSGKEVTDVIIQLEPGAKVQGKVTDDLGAPLKDVHITVDQPPFADVWFPPGLPIGQKNTFTLVTDAQGLYSTEGLYPGNYYITPDHADYTPIQAKRFTIKSGNEFVNQDFTLKAGHSIVGTIRDNFGKPVKSAQVTASFGGGDPRKITASSGEDGKYVLKRLEQQSYRLRAEATNSISRVINDVPSDSTGIDFVLEEFGRIEGKVLSQTDQRPITKLKVKILPILVETKPGEKRDMTDPRAMKEMYNDEAYREKEFASQSGEFVLEKVIPGDYIVEISCETHRERSVDGVVVRPGEVYPIPPFILVEGARFEGVMKDSLGRPLAANKVSMRLAAAEGQIVTEINPVTGESQRTNRPSTWPGRDGTINEEGFFSIGGLPPGKIRVQMMSQDYVCPTPEDFIFKDGVTRKDYTLKRRAQVSIRVKDDDGKPVMNPGGTVSNLDGTTAMVEGRQATCRGDSSGLLKVEKLGPGSYTILVRRYGYNTAQVQVNVEEGEEAIRDVTLSPIR